MSCTIYAVRVIFMGQNTVDFSEALPVSVLRLKSSLIGSPVGKD